MEELIKQLTEAIDSGKGTDWGWQGEEGDEQEFEYDTFTTGYALNAVLKVVLQSQIDLLLSLDSTEQCALSNEVSRKIDELQLELNKLTS